MNSLLRRFLRHPAPPASGDALRDLERERWERIARTERERGEMRAHEDLRRRLEGELATVRQPSMDERMRQMREGGRGQ